MSDTLQSDTLQMSDTLQLAIDGMSCASCVRRVEKAIAATPGVARASVNLATERAEVTFAGDADANPVLGAIERAGYGAHVLAEERTDDPEREKRRAEISTLLRSLGIAAALTLPIFV